MFTLLVAILLLRNAAALASDQHQLNLESFSADSSHSRTIMFELTRSMNASINRNMDSVSTSAIALHEELQTGYLNLATYTDASCTALSSAEIIPLNNCYSFAGTYLMFTATSTAYSASTYTDAKCQTSTNTVGPYVYSSVCANSVKKFVCPIMQISSITPIAYLK